MYFDDLEISKLELAAERDGWTLRHAVTTRTTTPGKIRKCRSCTDFDKFTDPHHDARRKFSPGSLMCYSVVARDADMLQRLVLTYPTHVNDVTDDGVSALHLAALDGNMDMIKILIGVNANVNLLDSNGLSVLDYAVQSGQFDASQYLIECGSDLARVRDGLLVF